MPKLTYACVLTRDIDRLEAFYRAVLQLEPTSSRGSYLSSRPRQDCSPCGPSMSSSRSLVIQPPGARQVAPSCSSSRLTT
jgi:hypothetical protein